LRALGHDGQHLVIGFTAGIPRMPLNLLLLKSCRIVGVNWGVFNNIDPRESDINSRELLDLYRRGLIRTGRVAPLPLEAGSRDCSPGRATCRRQARSARREGIRYRDRVTFARIGSLAANCRMTQDK
jgi:hypothetical protein